MSTTTGRRRGIPGLDVLTAVGEHAPTVEDKVQLAESIRRNTPDMGARLDRFFIEEYVRLRQGLTQAQITQERLKSLLDKLSSPPWHIGVYLGTAATARGVQAVVVVAGSRRVVGLADGVEMQHLAPGDEVLLSNELNLIMERSPPGAARFGETAVFDHYTADGRAVLRSRDDVLIVDIAGTLAGTVLKNGDRVRWDRAAWLVHERLEHTEGQRFLLGEAPDIGRDQVGGQDGSLEILLSALTTSLVAPDKARSYGLDGRRSILLVGPPGCGKTLMARVTVGEISRSTGERCRFGVVKPAEWESPWVGETQQNIRDCFKALREAAADGLAVLFLDEIESVGRIRGSVVGHHSDKFLAAFLAELDGFQERGRVAIIAATNRKDLVDPALLERLSDLEIQVGRPDMRGARAIFEIHLPDSVPFQQNGQTPADIRREVIETAVSRFYSPNADNELCVLRFRDGRTRTITARELASGRIFEQICRDAKQSAFLRDHRGGEPGIGIDDIQDALSHGIERLAGTLTARNVRSYLADLPQDVDVVSVDPVVRKVSRPHRYLSAA